MEPNTTQTPNYYYDVLLPMPLTLAELKVINAVIRETYGWGESNWEMSVSDLCKKTGLARANVQRAAARLVMGSDRLPAILGRKQNKAGVYVYWLLIDKSAVQKSVENPEGGHATITGGAMQHGQQGAMQHGPPKEERKYLKPKKKFPMSSVPTRAKESNADDDEESLFGSVLIESARRYFSELSNGTAWKETRDKDAFMQVSGVSLAVFLIGLCHCVHKSPEHRIGKLGYCVKQIQLTQKEMGTIDRQELNAIAWNEVRKTRACIRLGKWNLSEMSESEQQEVMRRDRRAG